MKLYLCNTIYQIIVTMQMILSINNAEENVILISDTISIAQKIVDNLKCLNKFQNSFELKVKDFDWKRWKFCFPASIKYDDYLEKRVKDLSFYNRINEVDEYYFANLSGIATVLGSYLKRKHPDVIFSIFEDGVSSYSRIYGDTINYVVNKPEIIKNLQTYLYPSVLTNVKQYYVFSPELMVWTPPYDVIAIPSIKNNINEIRKALNIIFDYSNLNDSYGEKVIFFEESYTEDGLAVNDLEIVDCLIKNYGKENIFVKLHPRVSVNRFISKGIKTNTNTLIPWELIAMNEDMSSKTLATITSTAVVNSFLLFQLDAEMVFEYDALKKHKNKRIAGTIEVIDKLRLLFPKKFKTIMDGEQL